MNRKILMLCVMRLAQNQKKESINSILQYGHIDKKYCFVVLTASQFPYVILCLNLMTFQTSKEKVLHTHKGFIRRIITLKY